MALSVSTVVFWLIALMTVSSAAITAAAKNILHAAFALCMSFLGVGAIYVFLHADFVAAVQLIVYVGGILVLIMFAVMFSSNVAEDTSKERRSISALLFGTVASIAVFALILLLIHRLEAPLAAQNKFGSVDYAATIGVKVDSRTLEQVAKDNTTIAVDEKVLALSNEELAKRVTDASGDAKKAAEEMRDAVGRQRGQYGLGHRLVGDYLLPFEVASILLLAALVGAVVIVRKELS